MNNTIENPKGQFYFVAIADIVDKSQAQFDQFVSQAVILWNDYGMTLELSVLQLGPLNKQTENKLPDAAMIIRVPSYDKFKAYLSDPRFKDVSQLRGQATDAFYVFEGRGSEQLLLRDKKPIGCLVFLRQPKDKTDPNIFSFRVTGGGYVKGEFPESLVHSNMIQLNSGDCSNNDGIGKSVFEGVLIF